MPALAIRVLLAGCAAAALAGCAASGPPMSVPPPARMVVLDSMERGAAPAPLVVYSFSTGCEAGLGALSRTVDVNRAALCEGFSAALGAGVRLLPHALGQFGAGYAGTPSEEALAQYRLVIRLIPEQYPGGRRDHPSSTVTTHKPLFLFDRPRDPQTTGSAPTRAQGSMATRYRASVVAARLQ